MQQAKQASAQQRTDDSDDQITDDSLAFPFCDQACEPAGHQTNQQEPNNIHYHTSSLASLRWFTSIGLLVSRSNRRCPQMFGNCDENDRVVILKAAGKDREARMPWGEIRSVVVG